MTLKIVFDYLLDFKKELDQHAYILIPFQPTWSGTDVALPKKGST